MNACSAPECVGNYVDEVREKYREMGLPVHIYEQGSAGPEAADALLGRDGHSWFD